MSAYVPNPPFTKLLGSGHSGHSQILSTSHPAPENRSTTSPASAAVWPPRNHSAHLPPPAPSPPHPRLIAKRRERGRTANTPNCPLPHPQGYGHYPLYNGQGPKAEPGRLGGSHSSRRQEEKVPSGQLRRPQTLAGVEVEMGSTARNTQSPQVQAVLAGRQLWVFERPDESSSPFCPK